MTLRPLTKTVGVPVAPNRWASDASASICLSNRPESSAAVNFATSSSSFFAYESSAGRSRPTAHAHEMAGAIAETQS